MKDVEEFIAWLHRQGKPQTRALRQWQYGDPAKHVKFESERGISMRHLVRKETAGDSFESLAPIDKLLTIWAEFISLRDSQVSTGLANPQDVKDFMRIGEAVEVMINDLKRHQWWAVRKSRGICSVWVFKDQHYEAHLTEAREILEKKMRVHIATARYFN